jgi:hypothetical protein
MVKKRSKKKKPTPPPERKLLNGEMVPVTPGRQILNIITTCPAKWLFVDMETGNVWHKRREEESWRNIGYVDIASMSSLVILPSAAGSIPRFRF